MSDFQEQTVSSEADVPELTETVGVPAPTYEELRQEVEALRYQMSSAQGVLKSTQDAIMQMNASKQQETLQQVQMLRSSLLSQKKEAFESADYSKLVEIDESLRKLDQQEAMTARVASPQVPYDQSPEFISWVSKNAPWYNVDKKKTAFAIAAAQELIAADPSLQGSGTRLLNRVLEEVNATFPDKGAMLRKSEKVGGVSRHDTSVEATGTSFDDLPPDAKSWCNKNADKFVGKGQFKDKASWQKYYAETYFNSSSR